MSLSDRERILTKIVSYLASTQLLARSADGYHSHSYKNAYGDYVHFAYDQKPVEGDLVVGKTGRIDQWKIAFYVSAPETPYGNHVLRDIDTGQLCNYGNEEFVPIRGMSPIDLLVGEERNLYVKVNKAFARGDKITYRPGGFSVSGDECTITICERWADELSIPFSLTMKWSKKTTIKAILAAMVEAGYGTRKFDRKQPEGVSA